VTVRPQRAPGFELVIKARLNPKDLGALLRKVREAAHVTQAELAKKLGVPFQNLSRLENGAREGMLCNPSTSGVLTWARWHLVENRAVG
jgi:transcriptional regulator with XRE-family HTH domain